MSFFLFKQLDIKISRRNNKIYFPQLKTDVMTPVKMTEVLVCHLSDLYPKMVVINQKIPNFASQSCHILEFHTQLAAKSFHVIYHKLREYIMFRTDSANSSKVVESNIHDLNVTNNLSSRSIDSSCDLKKDYNIDKCSIRSSNKSIRKSCVNDEQNINIIEVKSVNHNNDQHFNLKQHTDYNGITHIEIESNPVTLSNSEPVSSDFSSIISLSTPEPVTPSDETSSYHSFNNSSHASNRCSPRPHIKDFQYPNIDFLEKSIVPIDEPISEGGETFESKLARIRIENKIKVQPENSPLVNKNNRAFRKISPNYPQVRPSDKRLLCERVPLQNSDNKFKHNNNHIINRNNIKNIGPPTPPRRHPHDPSLLLIPTKSGQESKKAFYPKESHIIRGNKTVRVEYPSIPGVWSARENYQNNSRQYMHYSGGGWAHEFHSARAREPILTSELKRRSRSKSPARRQSGNRYLEAVSNFNIAQKLKGISGAMFSSKKSQNNAIVNTLPSVTPHRPFNNFDSHNSLKSVIKKHVDRTSDNDSRRVTFSAYTTVQLLG